MKSKLFFRTLLFTCWLPVVLAAVGVWIVGVQIAGEPARFIALGKLHVTLARPVGTTPEQVESLAAEFVSAQTKILQGAELKRRAVERVHALHPELKGVEVKLFVAPFKGSLIVKVAAVGEERIYVRVYLDALLDEYMALREDTRKGPAPDSHVQIMERPMIAVEDVQAPMPRLVIGGLAGAAAGFALALLVAGIVAVCFRKASGPPPVPRPADSRVRSAVNPYLFRKGLLITCWLPVAFAGTAAYLQSLTIEEMPARYVATGKVAVELPASPANQPGDVDTSMLPFDFLNTQIEILESRELMLRTLGTMRELHPSLKEAGVVIQATMKKNPLILTVTAVGDEPKYTQAYLDALLVEFVNFNSKFKLERGSVVTIMERASAALPDVPDSFRALTGAAVMGGVVGFGLMVMAALVLSLGIRSSER